MSADRVIYVGDGSSDVHVMLHVNNHDGFITIAVSEERTHARGLGQGADRPRADRRWAGVGAGNVDSAAGAALPAVVAGFLSRLPEPLRYDERMARSSLVGHRAARVRTT